MTIKTQDRDVQGPAQMARIVDAIRRGDGDGAYQAAMDHVTSASAIAQAVLTGRQLTD